MRRGARIREVLIDRVGWFLRCLQPQLLVPDAVSTVLRGGRWSPIRVALYRAAGCGLGAGTYLEDRVRLYGTVWGKATNLRIGADSVVGRGCTFGVDGTISVGRGARIGAEVQIYTTEHKLGAAENRSSRTVLVAPVSIGDGVTIGPRSIVLPGVTIGKNAIVAPGSVVTRDVAPGVRVGGVPARPLETDYDAVGSASPILEVAHAGERRLGILNLVDAAVMLVPDFFAYELRAKLYRAAGCSTGSGVEFCGRLRILGGRRAARNVRVGAFASLAPQCTIVARSAVSIGSGVGFGPFVTIVAAPRDTARGDDGAVMIGDGAVLMAGATVLPGVTIGRGAVIGAGALVTSEVAPNTFVGGVPARVIRELTEGAPL